MRYDVQTVELLRAAAGKARSLGHSYVGSAHLLMALTRQPGSTGQLLRYAGVDPVLTEEMAMLFYGAGTPDLPLPQGLSHGAKGILRGAVKEAKRMNSREIRPVHLLLALARRGESAAGELLDLEGVSSEELFHKTVEYLNREGRNDGKCKKEAVSLKLLEQFSEDLVQKASAMDPVIGRDKEIEQVIGILCRKNKNNPALVGEPGVGKTAIAEGLAQRMAVGSVPPQLKDKRLVSLNMANLVAGTKSRNGSGMCWRRSGGRGM